MDRVFRMPLITEKVIEDFKGWIDLIEYDDQGRAQWTQEAVDFVCFLNAEAQKRRGK